MSLVSLDSSSTNVAAATSDNIIFITDAHLSPITKLSGFNEGSITSVSFCPHSLHLLGAVSDDSSCVQLYDLRSSKSHVSRISIQNSSSLTSISFNPTDPFFIVGSSSGSIYNCSLQQRPTVVNSFDFLHSDTITDIQYLSNSLAISSSDDGLISLFDTTLPVDDCLNHVFNCDSAILNCGSFGNFIWGVTHISSISVFSQLNSEPLKPILEIKDCRSVLPINHVIAISPFVDDELLIFGATFDGEMIVSTLFSNISPFSIKLFDDSIRSFSCNQNCYYFGSDDGHLALVGYNGNSFEIGNKIFLGN
ncbi:hypothetical protein RCL1_000461 [Eukaryota sp. TZLM3-RCL]